MNNCKNRSFSRQQEELVMSLLAKPDKSSISSKNPSDRGKRKRRTRGNGRVATMDELFNLLSSSARIDKSKRKKKKAETPPPPRLSPGGIAYSGGSDDDSARDGGEAGGGDPAIRSRDRTGKRDSSSSKAESVRREEISAFRIGWVSASPPETGTTPPFPILWRRSGTCRPPGGGSDRRPPRRPRPTPCRRRRRSVRSSRRYCATSNREDGWIRRLYRCSSYPRCWEGGTSWDAHPQVRESPELS